MNRVPITIALAALSIFSATPVLSQGASQNGQPCPDNTVGSGTHAGNSAGNAASEQGVERLQRRNHRFECPGHATAHVTAPRCGSRHHAPCIPQEALRLSPIAVCRVTLSRSTASFASSWVANWISAYSSGDFGAPGARSGALLDGSCGGCSPLRTGPALKKEPRGGGASIPELSMKERVHHFPLRPNSQMSSVLSAVRLRYQVCVSYQLSTSFLT